MHGGKKPSLSERLLARFIPRPSRLTPPRYAERMMLAGRWAEYIGKPNIRKGMRPRRVPG